MVCSPSADEVHDLESVAFAQLSVRVLGSGHDVVVAFDRDERVSEPERFQDGSNRRAKRDLARLPVDLDLHGRGL